jgi:hypothetical protein
MTVRRRDDGGVELQGDCPSEEAESLMQYLLETPQATVDWRSCDHAHAAVVQVLMAARANLLGPPRGAFLREMVEHNLKPR